MMSRGGREREREKKKEEEEDWGGGAMDSQSPPGNREENLVPTQQQPWAEGEIVSACSTHQTTSSSDAQRGSRETTMPLGGMGWDGHQ
jgi:hypothetical protein